MIRKILVWVIGLSIIGWIVHNPNKAAGQLQGMGSALATWANGAIDFITALTT